jgi:hypothetical protein
LITLLKVPPPSVLTCHWNPVAVAEAMLKEVFAGAHIVWFEGCAVMAGPAPALIVNVISLVCVVAPVATPVIVRTYEPAAKVLVPVNLTVTLLPGITELLGKKLTEVPDGGALDETVIGLVNPPMGVVPKTISIKVGAGQVATAGAGLLNENPAGENTVNVAILDVVEAQPCRMITRYL